MASDTKNYSDSERRNPLLPLHGLHFLISSKVFLYATSHRIAHTMAFVTPVMEHWLELEIVQWVHHEVSIPRPIDHEQTLLPQSYISLLYFYWNATFLGKKMVITFVGARCSYVVRAFVHERRVIGSMLHRAISRSSQCSTKVVICAILSVGWCI